MRAPPKHGRPRRRALLAAGAVALVAAVAISAVLVATGGSNSVRLAAGDLGAIATDSGEVTAALPVNGQPTSVAVGNDGALWVASAATGRLSRIDPQSHAVTQIRVGKIPSRWR